MEGLAGEARGRVRMYQAAALYLHLQRQQVARGRQVDVEARGRVAGNDQRGEARHKAAGR
jgi:hypothetical protein